PPFPVALRPDGPAINAGGPGSGISEVRPLRVRGASGTFTLLSPGNGPSTADLPVTATAADIQAALNGLATIGGVGGSVSVALVGADFRVTFGGTLANTNVPVMVPSVTGGATVVTSTLTQGVAGGATDQRGRLRAL